MAINPSAVCYNDEMVFCYKWAQINGAHANYSGMFASSVGWIKSLFEFNIGLSPNFSKPLE